MCAARAPGRKSSSRRDRASPPHPDTSSVAIPRPHAGSKPAAMSTVVSILLAAIVGVAHGLREASLVAHADAVGSDDVDELWRTLEHTKWVMSATHFGRGGVAQPSPVDDDFEDEYAEGVGMSFRSDGGGTRWCVLTLGGFEQIDFDLERLDRGDWHGFSGVAALEDGSVPIRFHLGNSGRAEAEVGDTHRRLALRPASIASIFEQLGGFTRMSAEELQELLVGTNWVCEEDSWEFFFGKGGCEVARAGHIERVDLERARPGESSLYGRGPTWITESDWLATEVFSEARRFPGALFEFYRHMNSERRLVVEISFGRKSREVLLLTEVETAAAA
mmetsp:Transcript_68706/g.199319  ORF Transcript_68706/g.199319 Transcript_68706/m.199319 type:complete len:333 (+) Transcript_68706:3-1001(+)